MTADPRALARHALQIRRSFLQMHFKARSGHLGTGLSAIDLLTYIYSEIIGTSAPASQFILSKGHGASALYATLHHFGLLSDAMLQTYYTDATLLPAHPAPGAHPSIPIATGSLGHGLPVAVGLAYAAKHFATTASAAPRQVLCMLSDGECNEGSIWEAALFAGHHRLDNLTVIVDANGLQGFGTTAEVLDMAPLSHKWRAFRFATQDVDGHDMQALDAAFATPPQSAPRCLVARTTKGRGISFMEHSLAWHYLPLNAAQHAQAVAELDQAERLLSHAG